MATLKFDLQKISNFVDGIVGVPMEKQEINKSLIEMHNEVDAMIKRLATDTFDVLVTFLKIYNDEKYKDNFDIEPVFDSYGRGISISWISSKKEESLWSFSDTFKDIQTLNFMDFYQRFNKDPYINNSINTFTNYFKEAFHNEHNKFISETIDFNKITDLMINYLGMMNDMFEIMISRQEITQSINTLADSISDSEIFKDKPDLLELVVKEKNKSHDSTIVIDKITIYRDMLTDKN